MTKIDIISGFLGAGKTTLIKKLIQEAYVNQQIVLIENEFGEIGIDGGFLQDAGIEIKEMNSGCICCSLVGDFSKALEKVLEEYHPDRIVIEPSGVGKLSDVFKAVEDIALSHDGIEVQSLVAVADAKKCKMYMKNFGEFFNDQIEHAKTIVLSRTQDMTNDKLEALLQEIKKHNDDANIITTPWDDLNGMEILKVMEQGNDIMEMMEEHHHHHDHDEECECGHHHHHDHDEECECGHHHHHDHDEECECGHHHHHDHDEECECGHHHHHHHHADDVFTSLAFETTHRFTKEELENILSQLSDVQRFGQVLRAKGMLQDVNNTWLYFDMVPNEYEVRNGNPTYTGRFAVIGSQIKEDAIKQLFSIK